MKSFRPLKSFRQLEAEEFIARQMDEIQASVPKIVCVVCQVNSTFHSICEECLEELFQRCVVLPDVIPQYSTP